MTASMTITKQVEVTTHVDVTVDARDVLDAMSDDRLLKECRARGILAPENSEVPTDLLGDIRQAFWARDPQHFEILLMRLERQLPPGTKVGA